MNQPTEWMAIGAALDTAIVALEEVAELYEGEEPGALVIDPGAPGALLEAARLRAAAHRLHDLRQRISHPQGGCSPW